MGQRADGGRSYSDPIFEEDQGGASDGGSSASDAGLSDAGAPDVGLSDAGPPDAGVPAGCDEDGDGHVAVACGGDDCDDTDLWVHPGAPELCNFVDENCDEVLNDGLDCTFMAHGPYAMFRVDPFQATLEELGSIQLPLAALGSGMFDIDLDPAGDILGVAADGLYIKSGSSSYQRLHELALPDNTNGMAITGAGRIVITNSGGATTGAWEVDRESGDLDLIGSTSPYVSSGDCVVLKDGSLLMTARFPEDPSGTGPSGDALVRIDSATGATTLIGATGFHRIYGLSASFDDLFGVTDDGELLLLDPNTGEAELLHTFAGRSFYGAANGD